MLSVKPNVENEQVLTVLQEHFTTPILNIETVQGGQIAQTFSFTVDRQDYIIRFNNDNMGVNLEKEAYLYQLVASTTIPFPPIVKVGRLGELHYAISHKLPGQRIQTLARAEYEQVLPSIMDTLYAIHQVDVRDNPGYGTFDEHGVGLYAGWKESLTIIKDEEEPWNFYGKWHVLFQNSFLERDLFDALYERMTRLLEYCPAERYLVHAGYSFNNILADKGHVTGVLDWVDAKYGDFLYDVAGLDFWFPGGHLAELFQQYYAGKGVAVPDYAERLLCYQCYIGMDALRFFAKTQNHDAYQWTRKRILELMR